MRFWLFVKERFKGVPWLFLAVIYALVIIGMINLYSATGAHVSPARFNDQLNWVILGSGLLLVFGVILDVRWIERLTLLGYIFVCLLLLAVDLTGEVAKGSQRWLVMGPIRIQPSELAKFVIILIVARSFAYSKDTLHYTLFSLWRQILLILIPFLLILLQPDLGTSGLVLMIALFQLAFVRIDWKSIAFVSLAGLSVVFLAWNFILYDYQKLRVLNFLNPMKDPSGSGYHSIQSMVAVGSGGIWGRGFRQGSQAQLSFLPERHTDFAFSVFAEEHGFVGCMVIFLLYILIFVFALQIAERAKDTFSSLVALGVTAFFFLHFLINVTMVLGWFPVVGVPLSFMSYGGSHMLTALACVGLLVAVERRRQVVGG